MGPQAAKSYPGQRLVKPAGPEAERARQEIDYGRRGVAGHVFGAFQPATGAALTLTYERRTTVNRVGFLGKVEAWIDPAVERVYAVLDNLTIHSAPDVLLFSLLHPRWELVFQPKYAADLNLIEPWWKVLRSPALKGRRFEAWAEIERAVERAPPTGTITSIPSSGAVDGVTGRANVLASPPCQKQQLFSGCTTKRTAGRRGWRQGQGAARGGGRRARSAAASVAAISRPAPSRSAASLAASACGRSVLIAGQLVCSQGRRGARAARCRGLTGANDGA